MSGNLAAKGPRANVHPYWEKENVRKSEGKAWFLTASMMSGNLAASGGKGTKAYGPPLLGEGKCKEILRKSMVSDSQHDVRQSGGKGSKA